jgi:tRNA pseudouridine38-40 synthase
MCRAGNAGNSIVRIAAGIEYRGTGYCGWQKQATTSIPSIQATVEAALSSLADQPIEIICAGRTDKGVHASGQVIHFDTQAVRSEHAWLAGTNSYLPRDVVVTWVKEVDEAFHARFSAQSRRYQYTVYNSPIRPAINAEFLTWHFRELDLKRMQIAAQHLLGTHDFTSFRAVDCQAKSPIRTLDYIALDRQDRKIILDIRGNAFLHHMVRNIMGVFLKVGEGKAEPDWVLDLLACCDRSQAAETASASGLSLVEVSYPSEFEIPS